MKNCTVADFRFFQNVGFFVSFYNFFWIILLISMNRSVGGHTLSQSSLGPTSTTFVPNKKAKP